MPQNIFKKAIKDQSGFMAIVAIAIFFLLTIFGATIQMTILDTYSNVKALNNYYSARDVADSVIEYVNNILSTKKAGYNITETECKYGKYAVGGAANPDVCNAFSNLAVDPVNNGDRNLKISFSVKGRAEEDTDKLRTTKCTSGVLGGFNNDCYVVPFPGTGDAGENCNGYEPKLGDAGANTVPDEYANGAADLDQANYSCNWNKLIFGSSLVDRVTIPFYYDDDGLDPTINPFKGPDAIAHNFILRLRTPCKPCGYDNRNCAANVTDETVCANNERYVLNVDQAKGGDQIVVQWKLSGKCDSDEDDEDDEEDDNCGMVADPDPNVDSAFFESLIMNNTNQINGNFILLKNNSKGKYLNNFPTSEASFLSGISSHKLSNFSNPNLSLFLSSALIDHNGNNIPYLEYQVLTDRPIADAKTAIKVDILVDDNAFSNIVYKEVKKELLDFAVQN